MSQTTAEVMISIDNAPPVPGTVVVDQQRIDVTSRTATKPDPTWEIHDLAGHFHAYATDGGLPTLVERPRHMDCDGGNELHGPEDCDGYTVIEYFCRICDAQVEPSRLPDREPKSVPGLRSWTVSVRTEVPQEADVSVRAVDGRGGVYFGVARSTGRVEMVAHDQGMRVTSELYGIAALGQRQARTASVAA